MDPGRTYQLVADAWVGGWLVLRRGLPRVNNPRHATTKMGATRPNNWHTSRYDESIDTSAWLDMIKWDADGLVPAIAQGRAYPRVLMVAWNEPARRCN